MSEFLLALPQELSKLDSMLNFNKEEMLFDLNSTDNSLEIEHSVSIPGFSHIKKQPSFPFDQNLNNSEPSLITHIAGKRQLPHDEQSCSKLKRLETEAANFCAKLAAIEVLDTDKNEPIKNDVTLGATLVNLVSNNSGDTYDVVCTKILHNVNDAHEVNVMEESTSFSISKSADLQQVPSEMPNSANLEMPEKHTDSASISGRHDKVTVSENLVSDEKPLLSPDQFVVSGTEANEYPSAYESFSFSHYFVNSPEVEQKLCLSKSVCAAKDKKGNHTDTACVSSTNEISNLFDMAEHENQTSECADKNFATGYEANSRSLIASASDDLPCGYQMLPNNVTPINNSHLIENAIIQTHAAVKIENVSIKQESEPILDDMVDSVELLHNHEIEMDELALRNWLTSLVEQEEVLENDHEIQEFPDPVNAEDMCSDSVVYQESNQNEKKSSLLLPKQESTKDLSLEMSARDRNERLYKDFPTDYIQGGDIYADKTKNYTEDNFNCRFLQRLFPDVADISPVQKTDESISKEKNLDEGCVFTHLTAGTSGKDTKISPTISQHCENKLQCGTDTTTSRKTTDNHWLHHKKELLKKFSSSLEKEKTNGNFNETPVDNEQTKHTMGNEAFPSTSTLANDDRLANDCIVISDSDDSVIEFDGALSTPKPYKIRKLCDGLTSKPNRANLRKSRSPQPSTQQQAKNSTATVVNTEECIVLSDSDDELSEITSSAESAVRVNDSNTRTLNNRPEHQGIVDLSHSGRTRRGPLEESSPAQVKVHEVKANLIATTTVVDAPVDAFPITASLVATQKHRSVTHNNNNPNTVTRSYSTTEGNFGRELNDDVIDLSRRSFTQSVDFETYRSDGRHYVLDLSGSDGKENEEGIVTRSRRRATSGSERKQNEENTVTRSRRRASYEEPAEKELGDDTENDSARSCPICLESLLSGQSVSTTPCGHLFCTTCIETALFRFKKCPTCCRKVLLKRVHKIFL